MFKLEKNSEFYTKYKLCTQDNPNQHEHKHDTIMCCTHALNELKVLLWSPLVPLGGRCSKKCSFFARYNSILSIVFFLSFGR